MERVQIQKHHHKKPQEELPELEYSNEEATQVLETTKEVLGHIAIQMGEEDGDIN